MQIRFPWPINFPNITKEIEWNIKETVYEAEEEYKYEYIMFAKLWSF